VDDVYHRGMYRIVAMKAKLDLPGVVCEIGAALDGGVTPG
jgi:hypothetical protein